MTQIQPLQQPIPQPQTQDPVALLDEILAKSTESQKTKLINDSLTKRIETIRELLPEHLKPSAERFVKRAALYFAQRNDLQACSPASFILCVLQGAEVGLAIDGRLAHAIPYAKEAKFQCDYKGLVAVCRRNKVILDCYARIVCENDQYDAWEEDGTCRLIHRVHVNQPRGPVIGAYAKLILPHGIWRFEWMDITDINRIKARARSKSGPWVTDEDEMRKKTVLKRCLKTYLDDPDINRLLEVDSDYDVHEQTASNGVPKDDRSVDDILKAREQPVKQESSDDEDGIGDEDLTNDGKSID